MKRVSAWLMSLLPALSRQAGSSQADRMDRVEHMGGLLSTLGNVLSMVGDLLTSALQDSNPATDLDITYDINVEVRYRIVPHRTAPRPRNAFARTTRGFDIETPARVHACMHSRAHMCG